MLHHNSCLDHQQQPLLCNPRRSTCRLTELSHADSSTRLSVSDTDLTIAPAHRESAAAVEATCCSPGAADLHNSLHVMSRRPESPLSSRQQPRMIFSSTAAAAADHERGFAVAGGWSPRCYACSFCGREFNSAQALGGHMNIHRRDRARLRTSTSLASVPHQADLPSIPPQHTPQSPHTANLYLHPLRDSPTSISASLINASYPAPTIISATPAPFRLLDMRPAAEPALRPLAVHPSHDENSVASFPAPLMDLLPFRSASTHSSATRFSKTQSEAHSVFPNLALDQASPLLISPSLENSSLKPVEALNILSRQASNRQVRLDCSGARAAAAKAQHVQFTESKGRPKRARGAAADAITLSSEAMSTAQRSCDQQSSTSLSSSGKSNSLHVTAAPRSPAPHIKELIYLDLELRLGQSSASNSRASTAAAGNCCVQTPAPFPP